MVRAIVGANWGDEGKGKITDLFAGQSDIVIRFQGGANAGHTIINEHGRFAFHLMPSGFCSIVEPVTYFGIRIYQVQKLKCFVRVLASGVNTIDGTTYSCVGNDCVAILYC